MADRLASIYGTEKDKVNCSFYFKMGACRHGEKCTRKHVKPTYSPTILMPNIYLNPSHDQACTLTPEQLQQHFDLFYEDMFVELATKYGPVEELIICDNIGDHLVGNAYVRFEAEDVAAKAVEDLNKRWYAQRPVYAELSPVTDFRESCCRQYENGECNRGGYCNFMHMKYPARELKKELVASQNESIRLARNRKKLREARQEEQQYHHQFNDDRYHDYRQEDRDQRKHRYD